ncbi:hypothetical protein C4578_03750 [Candidatus Microgenomates bacterium]|jgi:hypothetical protein|nr:MAG: hypothetical protein C4578_03750 [Candidatus Microgenomates bacterium]
MEKEKFVSPETIPGKPFLQAVIRPRIGGGFLIEGLGIPTGWEKGKDLFPADPSFFNEKCFPEILKSLHFPSEVKGEVGIDRTTNLPKFISIETAPISYLFLEKEPEFKESRGSYRSNAASLEAAFALIHCASTFLNEARHKLGDSNQLAHLECVNNQFEPKDLGLDSTRLLPLGQTKQDSFLKKAKTLAAGFGEEIKFIEFKKGFLYYVELKSGNRAFYQLSEVFGQLQYFAHNVDTPKQAASLQSITASFINSL